MGKNGAIGDAAALTGHYHQSWKECRQSAGRKAERI